MNLWAVILRHHFAVHFDFSEKHSVNCRCVHFPDCFPDCKHVSHNIHIYVFTTGKRQFCCFPKNVLTQETYKVCVNMCMLLCVCVVAIRPWKTISEPDTPLSSRTTSKLPAHGAIIEVVNERKMSTLAGARGIRDCHHAKNTVNI